MNYMKYGTEARDEKVEVAIPSEIENMFIDAPVSDAVYQNSPGKNGGE